MFPVDAFRSTVSKIVKIFQQHSIPFHLTGGVTSIAYGEPRMTQDIDIVISNEAVAGCLDLFLESLSQSDFIKNDQAIRNAVASKGLFQLLDDIELLKLDIYPRELVEGELQRSAQLEVFEGLFLPIVSRADAAVSKLIWVSKGSHKSRRDLRRIWESCDAIERDFISKLAESMALTRLLGEAVSEPDEIE